MTYHTHKYWRNLANNSGPGAISTVGITSPVKLAKIGLNQSFIYLHPFPALSHFYLPLFNSVAKEPIFR